MFCVIRSVTATVAVALALSACGSDKAAESTSSTESATAAPTSEAPTPEAATPAPVAVDDEQQIRDLVDGQIEAFAAGDWNALAETMCAQYREQARDPGAYMVPPMDALIPRDQVAALSVSELSELLSGQFGGASDATVERVSRAMVDNDEPGYRAAMLDVLTESTTLTADQVENIEITGDTATADVTTTRAMGDQPPQSVTTEVPYVREDGVWLDCTDPAGS